MKNKVICSDEIPDSMFRKMFERNIFILFLVCASCVVASLFLYFTILEDKHKVQAKFNLKQDGEVVCSQSYHHQYLIRILKNNETRQKIIDKYKLIQKYGIDTTDRYYLIQLDKKLFDDLKVEEQSDGTILVSYIHENPQKSLEIIRDLIAFGLEEMKRQDPGIDLQENITCITDDFTKTKVYPKLLSIIFLITIPVLLSCIIFIAIKEKLSLNLNLDEHQKSN